MIKHATESKPLMHNEDKYNKNNKAGTYYITVE